MTGILNWFATSALGGIAKYALALIIAGLIKSVTEGGINGISLHSFWTLVAGVIAVVLPVILNALNPQDARYGLSKTG